MEMRIPNELKFEFRKLKSPRSCQTSRIFHNFHVESAFDDVFQWLIENLVIIREKLFRFPGIGARFRSGPPVPEPCSDPGQNFGTETGNN